MAESCHKPAKPGANNPPPVISSNTLFQGRNIIAIEHNGDRYALRITASGKLILTK